MLKVFVPKDRIVAYGETLHLAPSRYLAYAGEAEPVEVSLAAQPALAL